MQRTYEHMVEMIQSNLDFDSDRSPKKISPGDIYLSIADAVTRYSNDRPKEAYITLYGNGTQEYELPDDWQDDFSTIERVQFWNRDQVLAAIDSESIVNPDILTADTVTVYNDGSGARFRINPITVGFIPRERSEDNDPNSADRLVLRYTTSFSGTSITWDVPDADFEAVGYYAIGVLARKLAGKGIALTGSGRPGGGGTMELGRTQSDLYARYSQDMIKEYYRRMHLNMEGTPSTVINVSAGATASVRNTNNFIRGNTIERLTIGGS